MEKGAVYMFSAKFVLFFSRQRERCTSFHLEPSISPWQGWISFYWQDSISFSSFFPNYPHTLALAAIALPFPQPTSQHALCFFSKGDLDGGLQKMHAKEPKSPASITPIISLTSPLPRLDCNFLSFWTVCQTLWFLQRSKWNIWGVPLQIRPNS